ncbi:hypothetical protein D9M68_622830 [compost metagenome]
MPAMVITSATLPLATSERPWRSCSTGPSHRPRSVMKAAYDTQAKHSSPSVCGMANSGSRSRTAWRSDWRSGAGSSDAIVVRAGSCTRQKMTIHESTAKAVSAA